jgi:restriction enzyme bgcI subunit beta
MMKRLSEKEWGEFVLDDIFTVGAGKRLETRNKIEGMRPFIGATDNINGVTGFVGNDNMSKDSNVLGVNYNGAPCIAFYHPYECIFTDDVKRLHLKNQKDNKFVLLFFTSIFAMQRVKYSYGYKFKEKRMHRQKLMLPVDDKGNPDYAYMTLYSAGLRGGMLMRYKNFIAEQLSQLEHKDIPALDEKEWKQFGFAEVFDIKKGFYNKKPESDGTGTIPFLGATDSNNGVTRFLTLKEIKHGTKTGDLHNSPLEKKLFPGHAIAVTNNGSVGHAFYQATEFTCSHDINPLYLRDHEMSREEAAFLVKAIEQQGILFQYARKWRPIRMVKSKILLPVSDDGKPDYKYMEQYAKNMMLRKYEQYLAFIDRQSSAEEVNV